MKTIGYLIEKEFKQLMRNSFMPRLIILFPIMLLVVFPWAATLEVEDLQLVVIDNDHSQTSLRLLHQVEASDYFRLIQTCASYEEALTLMEKGDADLILEIPKDFEKERLLGRPAEVLIAANAVNGTKGGLGSSYLAQIINEASPQSSIRYLYNPNLDYKHFMIPALMTMMLVMICGFLPALNIVSEKENGTIEQINVTPVSKITFTLAKLLPYWLIGFFVLSVAMLLAWLIYGLVPAGSLGTIYVGAAIFILVASGIGLVISNYSSTMQQAMLVMWFFIMVMILMSGLLTPISSMPDWAQKIAAFNPLKYFVEFIRMVYLKGSHLAEVLNRLSILLCFALVFNVWAVVSYRKQQ